MAGIEKACEYSGEYPGPKMYGYKRDLIQVMPKYRKLFKEHEGFLLFLEKPIHGYESPWIHWYFHLFGKMFSIPKFWTRYYWHARDVGPFFSKPSGMCWDYCLYVPGLPGRVKGFYWNHTRNPVRAMSKLEKLVKYLWVDSTPFDDRELRKMCEKDGVTVESYIKDWAERIIKNNN